MKYEEEKISENETCRIFAGCDYKVDTSFTEKEVACEPIQCKSGEMPEHTREIQYDDNFCPIVKCIAIPTDSSETTHSSSGGTDSSTGEVANSGSTDSSHTDGTTEQTSSNTHGEETGSTSGSSTSSSGETTNHESDTSSHNTTDSESTKTDSGSSTSTGGNGANGSDLDSETGLPFCRPVPECSSGIDTFKLFRQSSSGSTCVDYMCQKTMGQRCFPQAYPSCVGDLMCEFDAQKTEGFGGYDPIFTCRAPK